jgi:hypothetical protein
MRPFTRRFAPFSPIVPICVLATAMSCQVGQVKAQTLGLAGHAVVAAPAPVSPPRFQLVDCTLSQLNACADTLNKCKAAAGGEKDEVAKCSKQMGGCVQGCGLIPRTCQWENVRPDFGRFTCGHPCRGGQC